jgi:hypothetical protein
MADLDLYRGYGDELEKQLLSLMQRKGPLRILAITCPCARLFRSLAGTEWHSRC